MIYRVSRGIFCKEDEKLKVLIYKRPLDNPYFSGMWCLPGGFLDGNESYEEALKREMEEETNLKVEKAKIFAVDDLFLDNDCFTTIFFLCEGNAEEVKETEAELAYVNEIEIEDYDVHPFDKKVIMDFFASKK